MKKALIITYYWPPAGGSGVQRWLKFVKYFRNFNVEPIVYTVQDANYPIVDESLVNEIPEGLEVIKQPIFEPNDILTFFGKKKQEGAGFLDPNPSFIGMILQYIRANYFIPDARKCWIKPSIKYLKSYLEENKIDVIITTGPPHSLHLIGLKLKGLTGVKWIADFRDPWTEIDYFHKLPLSKSSLRKHFSLEEKVLKKADVVLVVSKTMNENYHKYNENVITVTNGYDEEIAGEKIKLDTKFTFTHIGLMNADRNPTILWKVLAEIIKENHEFGKDFELKLIGKTDDSVVNDIDKYNLNNYVKFINYLAHEKVIEFQKKSNVLLLIVNNVPSAKGIVTGKIFEYLMAKRPILAIAPTNGDVADIITETNSGTTINFNDSSALKRAILNLYESHKKGKLKANSKNIEKFHRKNLTEKVSEIIYKITE